MRRLFVIIPLMLLLATFACIAWHAIPHHPSDGAYIADLQEQIDVLETRVQILEKHLDSTGE